MGWPSVPPGGRSPSACLVLRGDSLRARDCVARCGLAASAQSSGHRAEAADTGTFDAVAHAEWVRCTNADERVTKMKDGRAHPVCKHEHAVDLDARAIVAVTVQEAEKREHAESACDAFTGGSKLAFDPRGIRQEIPTGIRIRRVRYRQGLPPRRNAAAA